MILLRPYIWKKITLDESLLLRAVAILGILAHNYLHWISDTPGENEFGFRAERALNLINALWQTPLDSVRLLATYFGHYGVQVFFFLSGYGLAIKYSNSIPSWFSFQKRRWSSLYPAIITAALGYLLYQGFISGWSRVLHDQGWNLVLQIIGISNFFPDRVYYPIGPWWFIGVILQFYLIAPIILRLTQRYQDNILYGLVALALALEFTLAPILYNIFKLNINHTILGHLDVCVMGIWFARRKDIALTLPIMLLAAALFIAGNFSAIFWVPSSLALLVILIPLMRRACKYLCRNIIIHKSMLFLGQLSLYLFLCNGYLRYPLIGWAKTSPHWWTSIWTCLVFIIIAIIWSLIMKKFEKYLLKGC